MKRVRIADIMPPKLHQDVMSETFFRNHFHILLHEPYSHRGLLIGLDKYEARPLAMTIEDLPYDRREIYQFVDHLLKSVGMSMEGTYIIGNMEGGPLETKVRIRHKKETFDVACRPSDGFTLAIQNKSPIYISNEMLSKFSFVIPAKYRVYEPQQKGLEELVGKIRATVQEYEKEFAEMSKKAAHKSIEAYATSTKEVLQYLFGE